MNTSTVPYYTRINWQLVTTKPSATDIKLLEPISADASDYVADYQLYEIASEEVFGTSISHTDDYKIEVRSKIWGEINALYGAWAEREDVDDDWLDNLRAGWNIRLADLYETDTE